MRLAAIDIGSNSIKLVVVEATASDSFAVLAREREVVRLGHDTLREGYLAPAAIERAAETIKRFRSIAQARGAETVLATATASVREARNAPEFVEEIERRAGVRVEILSGVEEARLIGVAAATGCGQGAALVNVDIGGGSTEISLMRDGAARQLFSVRLGAVGLTEKFLASDPPKAKEVRALRGEVRAALERPPSSTARKIMGLEEVATLPREQAIEALAVATRRLAAYQRKWMRRIPGLVSVRADRPPEEVADEIVALAGARERLPGRRGA
ncbi:MAG: hypothetical protein M3444_12625 [Acidobacteriota bacterium]|nr:hypothetical protein [Acidobacteriota bacterium]